MWSAKSDNSIKEDVSISETNKKPQSDLTDNSSKYQGESSGGIDSGYLSGLQVDEDFSAIDLPPPPSSKKLSSSSLLSSPTNFENKKQNIFTDSQSSQTEQDYIDSGCIEVEEDLSALHLEDKEQQTSAPMILESGVDSGLTEWFCSLSLKNSNQPLNNLGTSSSNIVKKPNKDKQNAWEIYYQQNNDGDTQLHLACITGYIDVVAALIRMAPHPCLFNIQNDEAQTGLHLAVLTGQPKIVRMLLAAGAEPIVRDRNGNTPLHLASVSGDLQCVKALTIPISASEVQEAHRLYGHRSSDKSTSLLRCAQLPADLEIRNYEGERCVHLAAQGGHIEVLRHLVCFGADINAREGKTGRTALHIAIEGCNEILANFLLEECSKINIEAATYSGLTAYQVACILNNSQMQNNLEKCGAEIITPPDSENDSDGESDFDEPQIYDRFGDPGFFIGYNGGTTIDVA